MDTCELRLIEPMERSSSHLSILLVEIRGLSRTRDVTSMLYDLFKLKRETSAVRIVAVSYEVVRVSIFVYFDEIFFFVEKFRGE